MKFIALSQGQFTAEVRPRWPFEAPFALHRMGQLPRLNWRRDWEGTTIVGDSCYQAG